METPGLRDWTGCLSTSAPLKAPVTNLSELLCYTGPRGWGLPCSPLEYLLTTEETLLGASDLGYHTEKQLCSMRVGGEDPIGRAERAVEKEPHQNSAEAALDIRVCHTYRATIAQALSPTWCHDQTSDLLACYVYIPCMPSPRGLQRIGLALSGGLHSLG